MHIYLFSDAHDINQKYPYENNLFFFFATDTLTNYICALVLYKSHIYINNLQKKKKNANCNSTISEGNFTHTLCLYATFLFSIFYYWVRVQRMCLSFGELAYIYRKRDKPFAKTINRTHHVQSLHAIASKFKSKLNLAQETHASCLQNLCSCSSTVAASNRE